jgi:hypothetical protein
MEYEVEYANASGENVKIRFQSIRSAFKFMEGIPGSRVRAIFDDEQDENRDIYL